MTQSNTVRNFAITSTLGAIAAVMMLAQSGQASAKSVLSCDGSNRSSVVQCCEDNVNQHGMPFWMRQSGGSCTKAVKCVGRYSTAAAGYAKKCRFVAIMIENDGGPNNPGGKRGGRGNNKP
jgi:hypothetical protein